MSYVLELEVADGPVLELVHPVVVELVYSLYPEALVVVPLPLTQDLVLVSWESVFHFWLPVLGVP